MLSKPFCVTLAPSFQSKIPSLVKISYICDPSREGTLSELLDKIDKNRNETSTGRYGSIISTWQFTKVELSLNS